MLLLFHRRLSWWSTRGCTLCRSRQPQTRSSACGSDESGACTVEVADDGAMLLQLRSKSPCASHGQETQLAASCVFIVQGIGDPRKLPTYRPACFFGSRFPPRSGSPRCRATTDRLQIAFAFCRRKSCTDGGAKLSDCAPFTCSSDLLSRGMPLEVAVTSRMTTAAHARTKATSPLTAFERVWEALVRRWELFWHR